MLFVVCSDLMVGAIGDVHRVALWQALADIIEIYEDVDILACLSLMDILVYMYMCVACLYVCMYSCF